jgi:hydroxyacyl-ACP dehydratase HTD2-like protein with hotdog domain
MSTRDIPRAHQISMSSTSSNAIKEEERRRLPSSTRLTTRHNGSSQHDRHLRECRPSTIRHKSLSDPKIGEKTGPSASRQQSDIKMKEKQRQIIPK